MSGLLGIARSNILPPVLFAFVPEQVSVLLSSYVNRKSLGNFGKRNILHRPFFAPQCVKIKYEGERFDRILGPLLKDVYQ